MSCLSIVSQELYDKTLEGITEAAELRGIERFQPVVQGNYGDMNKICSCAKGKRV